MNRILYISLLWLGMSVLTYAQLPTLEYKINLTKVEDRELQIELQVPRLKEKELVFCLPKKLPNIIEYCDFGRFIKDFKAYDNKGEELLVVERDDNSWRIVNSKKLVKITYRVEATWESGKEWDIPKTVGSEFQKDELFLLNHNAILGYFESHEKLGVDLKIIRPANLYAATSLRSVPKSKASNIDIFKAVSYQELIKHPILYAKLDTTTMKLAYADILLQVYNPSGEVEAKDLLKKLKPLLLAQAAYMRNVYPVDHYTLLVYISDDVDVPQLTAHSHSSVFYIQEGYSEEVAQQMKEMMDSEMFHTIVPYLIHSEEVHDFNFSKPVPSKHSWLYEGWPAYVAEHTKVQQGLISLEQFLAVLDNKIEGAKAMDPNLSLTQLSKHAYEREYKEQYINFDLRGALVCLCLDLKLRILSKGEYGFINLMYDLSGYYGSDMPFVDTDLFDKIVEITGHKELKTFFEDCVESIEELPLLELLKQVGIEQKENFQLILNKNANKEQLKLLKSWLGEKVLITK
ncbi:MAG: hypothetical protein GY810_22530 [Aureispira sp.]|nr:hypothetical protein [Aureispira sp.]